MTDQQTPPGPPQPGDGADIPPADTAADRAPEAGAGEGSEAGPGGGASRRRRTAVAGLAALAVLAVAVTVWLQVGGNEQPAAERPDEPAAEQAEGPAADTRGLVTLDVEASSGPPGVPYLLDHAIVAPDGTQVPVEAPWELFEYTGITPFADGWIVVGEGPDNDPGAYVLDHNGAEITSFGPQRVPVVSPDGTVAAFDAAPFGIMIVEPDGTTRRVLTLEDGHRPRPGGVLGSAPCGDCRVFFTDENTRTGEQTAWVSDVAGNKERLAGLVAVQSVAADGAVAGYVEITDDGSCSALVDPAGSERWRTCENSLGSFSPDGSHLLGHPAYRDGAGDTSLAILDAGSGEVVAAWQVDPTTGALVGSAVWDRDGTVLATVFEDRAWALMRFSPDGGLTKVMDLPGGRMTAPPLHLPGV